MVRNGTNGSEGYTSGIESDVSDSDSRVVIDLTGSLIEDRSEPSGDDGIPTVEPQSILIEPEGGEPRRRRGRKPGSKNRTTSAASQKEVAGSLTNILLSLHWMGATILKAPELELEKEEAEKLGAAVAKVNAEFGYQLMSPKTEAIINLGMVGAGIYGPRLIAMRNNAKKAKAEKQRPQTAQVVM